MVHTIRVEVTVLAALVVAVTALIVALQAGGSESVSVAQGAADAGPVSVLDEVPADAREIDIANFAYDPDPVRVSAGEAVAWTNLDETPHTVTAEDASWGSTRLAQGDAVVLAFSEPGVYVYICTLHPPLLSLPIGDGETLLGGGGAGMQGTIIVE